MRFYSEEGKVTESHSVKVENCFAFLPRRIERPVPGYLWWEFYGRVYEYYNGAWHFQGILHKDFDKARFEDNSGKQDFVEWEYPNTLKKFIYFLRGFLVTVVWLTLIIMVVLLVHKYF